MSVAARTLVLAGAGLCVLGGLAMVWMQGTGWALIGMGAVLGLSVLVEGRYRGATRAGEPAPQSDVRWQRTGEREIDSETGDVVEVWYDAQTGQRRYEFTAAIPRP